MTTDKFVLTVKRRVCVFLAICLGIMSFSLSGTRAFALDAPAHVTVSSADLSDPLKGQYVTVLPDDIDGIEFYEIMSDTGMVIKLGADGGSVLMRNCSFVYVRYCAGGEYSPYVKFTLNSQSSVTLTDSASGISAFISDSAAIPENTGISAYRIVSGSTFRNIISAYSSLDQLTVYSLSMTAGGRSYTFGGNVTWTVPIPSDFTAPECKVYYFDGTESVELECVQEDGFITFKSDKTGIFYVYNDNGVHLGDVDGNGKITASDARTILRYSARLERLEPKQVLSCDVNRDGAVTAKDARLLLRYVASLEILEYLGGK